MRYVVQRLGFKIGRGTTIITLIAGALLGTAFWIGPFRPLPPDLRLLALSSDGQFRPMIAMPDSWADTTPPQPDITARFPLVLAVQNQGARGAVPQRVALSVPARFRIATSDGMAYPGQVSIGNPLVRYVFEVKTGRLDPGHMPRMLSNLDTLWLEPVVPSYYCTALTDSVPEFTVAPRHDPNALSNVQIYYSFDARVRDRQSGLLTVRLPPRLLERLPPPMPPQFQTTVYRPRAPVPQLGVLRQIGSRTSHCGDPGMSLEIYDVLWETATGGRFFVVYHGGAPRKHLYDLNRDSIIELETWDMNGDGVFEASRPARMVIPEFLMPPRRIAVVRDTMRGDSVRVDSTGVPVDSGGTVVPQFRYPTATFHNTEAGPFRFWRSERRSAGETIPEPPRPRPRTEPQLLGRPLPNFPMPPRRDTIVRDTIARAPGGSRR